MAKIEDYFSGKLVDKELEEFISELKTNAELRNEFEIYNKAFDFAVTQENRLIKDIRKLKDFKFEPESLIEINKYNRPLILNDNEKELSNLLKSESLSFKEKHSFRIFFSDWRKTAAILTLLIGLGATGIFFYHASYDEDDLFLKYYTPYEHSFTTRSSSVNFNNPFKEGSDLYERRNYSLALERFKNISDSLFYGDELNILEGVCEIELGSYNVAIEMFEKIDENSLYYTASLWYQGLSYLKLKDKRNAKRVFQKLKAIEPYYQKQSAKLLKYL